MPQRITLPTVPAESSRLSRALLGESPALKRLRRLIGQVAAVDSSILLLGESGTGKELVARAIHDASPRASKPFVAVNCAALPESLLESELFGHARGAFTGAQQRRPGLFVQASGGTLFLDEIADMPLSLQPRLLRALQERRVRAVGSDAEISVDVRLIAATHRDVEALVAAERLRADLLYRLDVIRLELPPLRARGDDILLLARRFLAQQSARLDRPTGTISDAARERLRAYPWPGNVRELQNCIERAVVLSESPDLDVIDLPPRIQRYAPPAPAPTPEPSADAALLPLHEVERRHILRVLAATDGNKATAARILQLDRKTLYRKLKQYGHDG